MTQELKENKGLQSNNADIGTKPRPQKKWKLSGRYSGEERSRKKVGRPEVSIVDKMAAKAWFHELKRVTKSKSVADVALLCDDDPTTRRYYKYARGEITPSLDTLEDVDDLMVKMKIGRIRKVFDDGPEGVPLWNALSGDYKALWEIVEHACPALVDLRKNESAHAAKVDCFISSILPGLAPDDAEANPRQEPVDETFGLQKIIEDEEHQVLALSALESHIRSQIEEKDERVISAGPEHPDWNRFHDDEHHRRAYVSEEISRRREYIREMLLPLSHNLRMHPLTAKARTRHSIMQLSDNQQLNFGFLQLAATISIWRISMMAMDSADKMGYIMDGLIASTIPQMLEPYGVEGEFVELLNNLLTAYRQWANRTTRD